MLIPPMDETVRALLDACRPNGARPNSTHTAQWRRSDPAHRRYRSCQGASCVSGVAIALQNMHGAVGHWKISNRVTAQHWNFSNVTIGRSLNLPAQPSSAVVTNLATHTTRSVSHVCSVPCVIAFHADSADG
jgi:hypothetical protein